MDNILNYLQLAVLLVGLGGIIWRSARTTGKFTQQVENLDRRVAQLETTDKVDRPLCDNRTADYRAALSESTQQFRDAIEKITRRLDEIEKNQGLATNTWEQRMHSLEQSLNELQVSVAQIATASKNTNRLLEKIMDQVILR